MSRAHYKNYFVSGSKGLYSGHPCFVVIKKKYMPESGGCDNSKSLNSSANSSSTSLVSAASKSELSIAGKKNEPSVKYVKIPLLGRAEKTIHTCWSCFLMALCIVTGESNSTCR